VVQLIRRLTTAAKTMILHIGVGIVTDHLAHAAGRVIFIGA
jgi:hypothetical protein